MQVRFSHFLLFISSGLFHLFSALFLGNVVVAHSNVNEEFKTGFLQLIQQWNDVAGTLLERQRTLKAASHHYGEFKVLTAQECDWQDKLDKKLMRSTTVAADAEEISEELDVIKTEFLYCAIYNN